jgi:hypothetical protein
LDKRIFEKQFKSKEEIKKISKWRAPIKNQNGEGLNSEISMLATVRATVPEPLHDPKFKNGDGAPVRRKPTYYIPLERARRGEHNETKNSRNG